MPINTNTKKVARAARTGGGPRRSARSYGWYGLLLVIVVVGSLITGYSRHERLAGTDYGDTRPLAPSPDRVGDFWAEAYGVYICDKFVPNINSDNDPYGILTQNDGLIHIHPYEKKYAGHDATLGLFADAVDLKLERDSVQVPGDTVTYSNGTKCGDKDGELVVKEWADPTKPADGKVIQGDPKTLLLKENAAVTIAFVPKGTTDIPLPATVSGTAAAAAADLAAASQSTGTDSGTSSTTVTPAAGDDTSSTTAVTPESTPTSP